MPKSKALLIGIDYFGTENELKGCIGDVKRIRDLLVYSGYSDHPSSMVILTDDQQGAYYPTGTSLPSRRSSPPTASTPSGQNMMAAMNWLVSGNQPGDKLFLHYSGYL